MEASANTVCTTGLLQFLWWQCSYATSPAPIQLSEVYSAVSVIARKDVYTYRVTIKHCSPPHPDSRGLEVRVGVNTSPAALSPTIDTVPEALSAQVLTIPCYHRKPLHTIVPL